MAAGIYYNSAAPRRHPPAVRAPPGRPYAAPVAPKRRGGRVPL